MISSVIDATVKIVLPIINLFIRNAERKKEIKEMVFRSVENHSKNVMKNIELRRILDKARQESRNVKVFKP